MATQIPTVEAIHLDVVEEVASEEGVSPLDLPPLYRSIDPGARDALLSPDHTIAPVTFTYCGYDVTVAGDGRVTVAGGD